MSYEQALKAAGAEVLAYQSFGSYQGDWWAKVRVNGTEEWVNGSYGSCSGCDAFEAEFGWGSGRCSEHEWDNDAAEGCAACAEAAKEYEARLADFGKRYLDGSLSQERAEEEAARNIEWDSDAAAMVAWIKENALGT